jgi:hypothetical protein
MCAYTAVLVMMYAYVAVQRAAPARSPPCTSWPPPYMMMHVTPTAEPPGASCFNNTKLSTTKERSQRSASTTTATPPGPTGRVGASFFLGAPKTRIDGLRTTVNSVPHRLGQTPRLVQVPKPPCVYYRTRSAGQCTGLGQG